MFANISNHEPKYYEFRSKLPNAPIIEKFHTKTSNVYTLKLK